MKDCFPDLVNKWGRSIAHIPFDDRSAVVLFRKAGTNNDVKV